MSTALKTIRTGRGLGLTEVPVVTLALVGNGQTWHVLDGEAALCKTKGELGQVEDELDAKVVFFQRKPVCQRCRAALGDVPMPRLVRQPPRGGSH